MNMSAIIWMFVGATIAALPVCRMLRHQGYVAEDQQAREIDLRRRERNMAGAEQELRVRQRRLAQERIQLDDDVARFTAAAAEARRENLPAEAESIARQAAQRHSARQTALRRAGAALADADATESGATA